MSKVIRLGTRDSQLAMWQTHWVQQKLHELFPEIDLEIISLKTKGDKILDVPLAKIGDKGLFTKELDQALLDSQIDLAVHSLKDVPTHLPDGLIIGAVTERWDACDVFISKGNVLILDLPQGAQIATSSLRRKSQLLHLRPDFQIVDIRGNLNTRFRKFDESDWSGMILAAAGVERLGFADRITQRLTDEVMLPAVGQGSFAVMCRKDDSAVYDLIQKLNHVPSERATTAERALLRHLEGGCQIPIGAKAIVQDNQLALKACVGSLDGQTLYRSELTGLAAQPEAVGIELADTLIHMGASKILEAIRNHATS